MRSDRSEELGIGFSSSFIIKKFGERRRHHFTIWGIPGSSPGDRRADATGNRLIAASSVAELLTSSHC